MSDARTCPTCGAALAADAPGSACPKCMFQAGFATGGSPSAESVPSPEELAPKFPGLAIESVLGRGGMGVVYKARHKALDRDVALKVLPSSVAGDLGFAERFQREARALAKLQHPNIVAVHDFGETDGLFWLVMEYVDGANIRQAMRAGEIGPKEALAIVPQICDALQYAHEHGVVHRDIKPENVLLDKTGRVKVADFGLAKLMAPGGVDRTLTGAGQVMGTPHYMAPEQVEHPADVDHRADIYSLGVVFYEMLTGELPMGRFAAPSGKCDVDARIDEIVLRTLEKEREARYQRVVEVKTDVGRVAEGSAPAAAAEPPSRGRLSKLALAGVCGVPIAALAMIAGMSLSFHAPMTMAVSAFFLVGGWIASVVALWRIHRDSERLRGRAWAIAGAVLPVVAACAGVPLALAVSPRMDAMFPTALQGDERQIEAKWSRLADLGEHVAFADVLPLYERSSRNTLTAMNQRERDNRARSGILGLPLFPSDQWPAPLGLFHIDHVGYQPSRADWTVRAIVVATDGKSTIRFPMSRENGTWDFAVGPVEIK